MKKSSIFMILGCVLFLGACTEDKLSSEANIITSFSIRNMDNAEFRGIIGADNVITLKVSPYLEADTVLKDAVAYFYLSRGATVSPDPREPQNFAQPGGVKYTVTAEDGKTQNVYTVVWSVSDQMAYGEGFSYAEIGTAKSFVEMGYPGEVGNTGLPSIEYGDLLMYHAYCGNYIVLLSRVYIDENPASPHCVKVVDKSTLNPAGTLNLGSISVTDLKMITSDYKGRCVGAVVKGEQTEFFYWATPTDAPRSVGTINVNMASSTDGSANFQVAGDITADAWVTALAPRGPAGAHYRVKVTGGQLASSYTTVETGYSSSDCSGFQMISPLDDSDNPSFVIGDSEGTANAANSIKCYVNSPVGFTSFIMPPLWQNTLQAWWVGTGFATARTGGRSPVVSALPINGKTYIVVTTGTSWWFASAVLTADLQTLAHENLNVAFDIAASRGWSYGEWADWYWDDNTNEAYLAIWFGRLGLYTFKLTCFE